MMISNHFTCTFVLCLLIGISLASKRDYANRHYYALHTEKNEIQHVQELTQQLGATFEGRVGELANYFWISFPPEYIPPLKHSNLAKRDHLDYKIYPQIPSKRLFKRPYIDVGDWVPNATQPGLEEYRGFQRMKNYLDINNPGFNFQWHHINRVELGNDLNVTGVWSQGITGKGVAIAILDDGLDMDHKDLLPNYFPEGSYDFNDHVLAPVPRLVDDTHGTRCAGEIAAIKNGSCGVGVAYDAKVAGVRILSGELTEADEAAAINYAFQKNHIYSCSWGPPDSGDVVQGPPPIVLDAIKNGISNGRNGSGSVFVFASGNGGANEDNCNFDGYTNSIYTLTVGAIDRHGQHPTYAEKCAAQLMVAYSSGKGSHIYTTDVGNECSNNHGGTSAAAPLVAGVLALVLSVRPDLSWRDVQHLCVQSATPFSLDDPDWADLPSGRKFNHKFGYGVVDAYKIVEMAKDFKRVGDQVSLDIESPTDLSDLIPDITPAMINKDQAYTNTLNVTEQHMEDAQLSRVEHVTVTVNIQHERRGDLEIYLQSPNGVVSQLATARINDESTEGFDNWTFMTVKHWEENPIGSWTLIVMDGKNPQHTGTFHGWKMILWGEKVTDSPIKEIELSSRNTTGDIKPKIEIHGTEKNEDPASNIENNSVKNISIYQSIMGKLALLKEKLKMLQKADSILKEQETEHEKIEEQQKDVSFGDIKVAEDSVETADQPLKDTSKDPSDKNTLEVEHHEASTPKLESNEPTKLGNARINQLKSDINTPLMTSSEKSAFESTHVSILFFALLIMTIACIVFIFKKYVVVSDKLVSYMNGSSHSYELRELLIQQNENDLNSPL